jgi:hypothetical protein
MFWEILKVNISGCEMITFSIPPNLGTLASTSPKVLDTYFNLYLLKVFLGTLCKDQ